MKRRILKIWQFILLLVMLVLIPQTMFLPVLHVDRDVAENIAEKLKDEAGENIKDNVFLSIAENILLEQIPEESLSGYELMTKFPIPMCFLYFGSLPVLVLLIVFFCFKRTKFVPIIAAGVYSLFGIICSSIFLWGVPGQIFSGFQPAQNVFRFLWKEILSVGMYITFCLCILLFVVLVIITVTCNQGITVKKRELSAAANKEVAVINTNFKEECNMSKSCPKCGNVLNDTAAFCNKCGYQFGTNAQQRNYQQQGYQQGYQQPVSGGNELIVDSDEQIVMNLQNSYVSTMAADGSIGSTRVFFTNKRFYAKENRFTLSRGLDTKNTIVELQEISGTQILHENPISYFIWGGFLLIFNLIIGAIAGGEALVGALISGLFYAGLFTLLYFLRRGTYLLISFAGETVKLRVKMYNYNSVVTFLQGLQSYIARLKK